ncbi:MAG: M28 family peptidase [Vicinamibacterales bacterium]
MPFSATPATRRAALALAGLLCGAAAPYAGQAPRPVDANPADGIAMLATITRLSADDMAGRAAGSEGGRSARAYIESRLTALGIPAAGPSGFEAPFAFTTKAGASVSGVNLVARCAGRRPDAPAIVVSAHYDHLGVRDGRIYHGADDNASGVALLLLVAERCRREPFDHPLLVAFFDAEEQGLQGARAFVQSPPIPATRIALDVNFDMVSRSDANEIYVAGPGRWPALGPVLRAALAGGPVTVRFGHDTGGGHDDWTTQSDHGAFHAAGIPFVYFGVEDHADYHQPTDTADKISPRFLSGVAATVLRALAALDGLDAYK